MEDRQELHCHACGKYVQFNIDLSMNGNHVIKCPNCGHEHYRIVRDGIITSERWGSSNGVTIYTSNVTTSATGASTWNTYATGSSTGNYFSYSSWLNTTGNK